MSIRVKLVLSITLLSMLVCSITGIVIGNKVEPNYTAQIINEAKDVAELASYFVDVEKLKQIEPGMEDSDVYKELADTLRTYLVSDRMEYIYIVGKNEKGGYQYLVDADEEAPAAIGDDCEMFEGMTAAFAGEASADDEITEDEWGAFISGYAPIYDGDEVIAIIGIDYVAAEIAEYMNSLYIIVILAIICGVIISIIGTTLIVGRITRNIRKIVVKIDDVVHNDGDLTQTIDMKSGDETELIASLFNEFQEAVRNVIEELNTSSGNVKKSSIKVVSNVGEFENHMDDIVERLHNTDDLMLKTASSVERIRDSVCEIETVSKTILSNVERGTEFSGEIGHRAVELKNAAVSMKEQSAEVTKRITGILREKIAESEAVKKIEELSRNIIDISGHSNLLALNASIEAARAGDAGKGFAVVAEEIAKMATDTKEAAEKISGISDTAMNAVKGLAEAAAELADYVNGTVREDYETFEETGNTYVQDASNIEEMMEEFQREAENLRKNMGAIQNAVNVVECNMRHTGEDIGGITQLSDDMKHGIRDIYEMSVENDSAMNEMENAAKRFKC